MVFLGSPQRVEKVEGEAAAATQRDFSAAEAVPDATSRKVFFIDETFVDPAADAAASLPFSAVLVVATDHRIESSSFEERKALVADDVPVAATDPTIESSAFEELKALVADEGAL